MGRPKGSKNNKHKVNKNSSKFFNSDKKSLKSLRCINYEKCSKEEIVDSDAIQVICHTCVQDMVGVDPKMLRPTMAKREKSEFPKGWHLYKQYVHKDGRVFEYGKEVEKLKGKLKPTVIKVSPKLTRSQRRRIRDEKESKRDARLVKRYKKVQKIKKKENENEDS